MLKCYCQTVLEAKVILYKKVPVIVNLGNYNFYRDLAIAYKVLQLKKKKEGGEISVIDSLIQQSKFNP